MHRYASVCIVFIVSSPLFSPLDYETDAAAGALIDYVVADPYLPEQPGKPPLITRYRLFLLSTACIKAV